ncbi:MAG: hypothetical protein DCC67_05340 [Planctomycetota bacterium]|nr:MAG: hypothetical protein DCC67_05340 [Planctomycetota bacterium]
MLAVTSASVENWWSEQFFGLDQNQRFIVILTAIGCLTGVVITLAGILYSAIDSAHRRRSEASLKREMLDRGMSADEVVKVIEASTPVDAASRVVHAWCKRK